MNAEVFSDAMDVIDIKYVEEAMCYRRKKISVPWIKIGAVAAACILLVGTFTILNFSKRNQQGVFETEPRRTLPSEKVEDTKTTIDSETNPGISTGECAADMHRPAGYHPRIGSALALKLSLHKESPEKVYDVVIPCFHRFGEDDCIVERLSDRLDTTSWRRWARIQWPDRGIEESQSISLSALVSSFSNNAKSAGDNGIVRKLPRRSFTPISASVTGRCAVIPWSYA